MVFIRPPYAVTWQSIIVNKATTLLPRRVESFTHVKPGDYKEFMVQTMRTGQITMADRRIHKLRGITELILHMLLTRKLDRLLRDLRKFGFNNHRTLENI